MNRLQLVLHLSGALAGRRAAFAYQGHVLRDPEALLHSRRGSDDPYRLYERVRDGTVDLVGTFAAALSSAVLVHLLGIPDDHAARFVRSGAVIGSGIDGIHSLAHARKLATATAGIEEIFTELLDRGRDSPVQRAGRSGPFDLEVAGCRVERGDYIVALIGGANRDPAAHPDPDTFDVLRPTRAENLAFSHGIHYCLGKPLARLEAAVALRKLAERLPHLRAAGRARRRTSSLVRGFTRYPVAV